MYTSGMKKRKVTLTIEIPAWVPPWREFVRWYKTARYALLPFRCTVTGKRLQFRNASYEYDHGGGRVMVSTWGASLCREELIKFISRHFTDPTLHTCHRGGVEIRKCDSCGHVKPTISSGEKMNFGMQWWNGFHLCELCLTETVRLGTAKSSVYSYHNGKSVCVNEAGVHVHPVKPTGTTKVEICSEKPNSHW